MTRLTPLCQQLVMGLPGDPLTLKALKEARQWLENQILKIGQSPPSPPLNRLSGPKCARLAPLFLLDGIWLAGLFSPATGHLASHCRLHPIFIDSLSLGSTKRSTGDTFRAYLNQQGEPVHGLEYPSLFIQDLNTQGSAMALTILVFQHLKRRVILSADAIIRSWLNRRFKRRLSIIKRSEGSRSERPSTDSPSTLYQDPLIQRTKVRLNPPETR